MDPLSEVLSLLKPRSYSSGGFDLGGELSVQFPQHEGIKLGMIVAMSPKRNTDPVLCTNPMLFGEEIIMAETTYNPAQSHRAAIV
jgi:hypothetical protein